MVNYVLMMTWLPATVIMVEELNLKLCKCFGKCWQSYVDTLNVGIERFGNLMENTIINLVKKFKYIFLVVFCKFDPFANHRNVCNAFVFFISCGWNFKRCNRVILSEVGIARLTKFSITRQQSSFRIVR